MNIGILGGGQLGWMTILEGRKLGFNFFVLDADQRAPASRIADMWFHPDQVREFRDHCDIITWEFEHIEEGIIDKCLDRLATPPRALEIKWKRSREKAFLSEIGIEVPEYIVCNGGDLERELKNFGLPAVVKADRLGYDGKGQFLVRDEEDLNSLGNSVKEEETYVVERFIDFAKELSVIVVRSREGEVRAYPVTENVHREGILIRNRVLTSFERAETALGVAEKIAQELSITGLLTVEFFLTKEGRLLVNEIAPRPHNTGHYTLDGALTSQFENLVRVLSSLSLGSTEPVRYAGMVNILGTPYEALPVSEILSIEGAKLYWYGKEPRPRRKLGHVNVVKKSEEDLLEDLLKIESLLHSTSGVPG